MIRHWPRVRGDVLWLDQQSESDWELAYLPYNDEPVRRTAVGPSRSIDCFDHILMAARAAS